MSPHNLFCAEIRKTSIHVLFVEKKCLIWRKYVYLLTDEDIHTVTEEIRKTFIKAFKKTDEDFLEEAKK